MCCIAVNTGLCIAVFKQKIAVILYSKLYGKKCLKTVSFYGKNLLSKYL